jgi:hypothetical protein
MKKYIVTSSQFMGELVFGYQHNQLVFMDLDAISEVPSFLAYVYSKLPVSSEALQGWLASSKTMKIREVPADLTFENFWNTYGYKVGNKPKAQKLWNALKDQKKALALMKIKPYQKYVEAAAIAMIYPERYLSQERYENEF